MKKEPEYQNQANQSQKQKLDAAKNHAKLSSQGDLCRSWTMPSTPFRWDGQAAHPKLAEMNVRHFEIDSDGWKRQEKMQE